MWSVGVHLERLDDIACVKEALSGVYRRRSVDLLSRYGGSGDWLLFGIDEDVGPLLHHHHGVKRPSDVVE